MKAQVLYGINNLKYEANYKNPVLKENEVLVEVKACGICGSDIDRVLKNGTYHFPTIIGHEFSGIVKDSASEKGKIWINKRVSVFPLIPCNECNSCKSGNFQLCENYSYLGSRCDGGFAECVAVPIWNLIEIPDGISYEEAAMMEPCSVAMHAIKIAGNLIGKNVLITGAGTITSILVKLAFVAGAAKVVVIARNNEKLNYLKSKSPEVIVINSETENLCLEVKNSIDGYVDVVIEGTGASNMLEKAISVVARRGSIVTMGNPSNDIGLTRNIYWQILRKELVLKGTWNSSFGIEGKNDWKDVFSLMKTGKLNIKDLISHKIKLENLMDGILLMSMKKEISNKVMVVNDEK